MSTDTTQYTPAEVRGRIIRASILPIEDEETMIAGLRAGAEAVERGELDAEDFAGIWSQYLREVFRRASSVPAPADVRERIKAAIREGVRYVAKADGAYLYEPSVDETADRILALLRTPRGEGAGVVAAASAYLRALDTYRKECRDREIPLAEYAYDEFRRLAEPLVEAEERLRAALRSEAQGEEDVGEFCDLCGEEFDPRESGTVTGPLGQDDGVPRWYRCPRCARAYNAGYQQGQRDPRGDETADPTAIRSDAQGEDRWEDLVFGPITEAYNEAHAARRGEGGGDG